MASKASAIFCFSLLLFAFLVNACIPCKPTEPPPKPKLPPPKPKLPPPEPKLPPPKPNLPPPEPKLPPPAPKKPPPNPFCPRDTLKFGVCADILGGVVGSVIGTPPKSKCCALVEGLSDTEAAICLCTALKANVLGINLDVPLSLSVLVSSCEKKIPDGFKCV